jgi:hypothetical protein
MQIDEYSRIFLQMEMEEGLFFSRTPNGDPFWDVIRYEVFFLLFDEVNEPGQPHNPSVSRLQHSWLAKIHSSALKIGLMANQWARFKRIRPADFVAFVCSRYKDVDGTPIDFAADNALLTLAEMGSIQRIESQFNLFQDVNFNTLLSVATRVYRSPARYQKFYRQIATIIADAEQKYFGLSDPNLLDNIRWIYSRHLTERRIWREILNHSRPRLVLMTQNGIQKGLILEARRRYIPVVEFQHCSISTMHPAYSYPQDLTAGDSVMLPDALLLFSEYWNNKCSMPGTQMVVVGNDRFSSSGTLSTRSGAAVFVNHPVFHKYMSPLAMEVAQSMPDRFFIMKLHPSQLADRAMIEREYQVIQNLAVVGMEKSIPELMMDASDVIIIDSTSSYEALDRGVPVHILKKGPYMAYQDLFTRPDVYRFSTAEELQRALFKPMNRPEGIPRFFHDFDPVVFRELVRGQVRSPQDTRRIHKGSAFKATRASK